MKRYQKQKIRRRLRPVILLPVLVLLIVTGSLLTYAAMISRDKKVNEFQIGQLETKIDEIFTEPASIIPDKDIEKKVQITNTGTLNQFVRVMLHPEISVSNKGLSRLLPSKIGQEILLDLDTKNWMYGEDGYYYYLDVLKAKDSTPKLFTTVKLNKNVGVEYHQAQFTLLVKAETSTTAKFAYRDAWWQSETPTKGALLEIDARLKNKTE